MRFGTIVVVGGGCYGSYYVRQLRRARDAAKVEWTRLVVVDRDPRCAVAASDGDVPELAVAEWPAFFGTYLSAAADDPDAHARDAVVPSPLMPHLFFEWVHARARRRWPRHAIEAHAPAELEGIPWQKAGADGTRYVSYATWMCPINCIEPATCPHTRGPRDWSLHEALPRTGGTTATAVLRVTHRTYGVGMVDVAEVLAADRLVAERLPGAGAVRIATASHCHGAVAELRFGPAVSPASPTGEI